MPKIKLLKNESINPKTVTIGSKIWMAENLAVGDGGPGVYFSKETGEYYYNWLAAVRIAKSIPGWHLPTVDEWASAVESMRKNNLKVKFVGARSSGAFSNLGLDAHFWTSTEHSEYQAFNHYFSISGPRGIYPEDKIYYACSVRLVKN